MKALLLSSLVVLGACGGPTFESLCDRLSDECGLPDAQVTECKQFAALANDAAEQTGCESELDDYIACIDGQESFCTQSFDDDVCASESKALDDCASVEAQDDSPAPG